MGCTGPESQSTVCVTGVNYDYSILCCIYNSINASYYNLLKKHMIWLLLFLQLQSIFKQNYFAMNKKVYGFVCRTR